MFFFYKRQINKKQNEKNIQKANDLNIKNTFQLKKK